MRKVLLYLFIGTVCSTPAFCATVLRSDTDSNRISRSASETDTVTQNRTTVSRSGTPQHSESVSRSAVVATPTNVVARTADTKQNVIGRSAQNVPMQQTSANIARRIVSVIPGARSVSGRAAVTVPTPESISQAKEVLERTAELNKSCQAQYNECMDQFCAVVDTNQKRCSCSANLSKYTKVEEAVTDANNQLNEVAQRIRYVGLSADEIRAIMTATEAEIALEGQTDVSETRNMLDEIENLIKDPTAASTYYSSYNSGFGLDMDIDFTSESFDIFDLDFLSTESSSSISNKRGTELYNIAKKRCNTILNECKDAGATTTQVTGNYDLAIDKDCIAYEQGLSKLNDTLVSNVRSANLMLQKARLAVLQNKNQYDAKGCIGALETCMLDDMVCGSDYMKCLDPTKKYIDDNGEVVLGQDISQITKSMANYDNASIASIVTDLPSNYTNCDTDSNGKCIVKYLLEKIGTGATYKDGGLCRPVLDKCQQYTYDKNGTYLPYNDVVKNYLQRAMVNIKAQQARAISDYAESCMTDVASCYNQQVTQINTWSMYASASNIKSVMTGACRNVALTCAYAIFANDSSSCAENNQNGCIENISQMFYQSLLCPENSEYQKDGCSDSDSVCVNSQCKCVDNFVAWNGNCVTPCDSDTEERNTVSGVCQCSSGYTKQDGQCVVKNSTTNSTDSSSAEE